VWGRDQIIFFRMCVSFFQSTTCWKDYSFPI
jgi:hypothetical protein